MAATYQKLLPLAVIECHTYFVGGLQFKCLGNCPICGKCSFLKEREAEDQYAATSKVTVLSGLYRKEVDKAFAQVFRGFGADALHPHGFDASLQRAAEPTLFLF